MGAEKVSFGFNFGANSVSWIALEAPLTFEFDDIKSQANLAKHGLDFVAAQALWLDDSRVEIPARTVDEPRFVTIGVIEGRHWSAVFTLREGRIRLISVRRSRREEVAIYESE